MTGFTAVLLYAAWMPLLTIVYVLPDSAGADDRKRPIRGPAARPRMIRRRRTSHHAHLKCVENFRCSRPSSSSPRSWVRA